MSNKIFIVRNARNNWHEVKEEDLQVWLDDGSIESGDIVFEVKKTMIAKQDKVILEDFEDYHVGFGE